MRTFTVKWNPVNFVIGTVGLLIVWGASHSLLAIVGACIATIRVELGE